MAASSSDKFRKGARKWVGQIGAGGVSDASVTTIPLASATGLPTDTGVTVVIDRVDSAGTKTPSLEETITGVVSGSNLVTSVRGVEGTAQAHLAGAVVEVLITNAGYNDIIDGILVGHGQDGVHKSGSVFTLPQINDTSSDHQYVMSVCELVADRTVALPLLTGDDEFTFNAHTQTLTNKTLTSPVINTAISGTAIVDEDTMVSDSATKVPTQQSVKAYVDGKVGDWTSLADTCVYASPSTFTIAGVDRTSIFRPGTRFYFTQTTGKYAVVEKSVFSTNTTVTITVNSDYVIANAAITAPYYSYALMPSGYPDYFQITPSTSNTSGFSAVSGYTYRYSMVGRAITISLQIGGISNAASLTINLPATVANASGLVNTPVAVQDNGTWQASPGIAAPNPNAATLLVGKTIGSIASGTYAGFTSSGTKLVDCNLTYYV